MWCTPRAADGERPSDFLGQFGIGILACFVVSDSIVVYSKSAKDPAAKAVEWRAKPDGTYTLKELDRDLSVGTQVWLTAKPGCEDHFAPDAVRDCCSTTPAPPWPRPWACVPTR